MSEVITEEERSRRWERIGLNHKQFLQGKKGGRHVGDATLWQGGVRAGN